MVARTYLNATFGNWEVPSSWTGNAFPVTGDDATINVPGSYVVTIFSSQSETVNSLTLGAANLSSNGTLSVASNMTIANGATYFAGGSLTVGGSLALAGVLEDISGRDATVNAGTLTNTGTILLDQGSSLTLTGAMTNLQTNTLTGGTYAVYNPTGSITFLNLQSSRITTLAATVILSGDGALLESFDPSSSGVMIENSLQTIAAAGVLDLRAGRGFGGGSSIVNAGSVLLSGGSFSFNSESIAAGGVIRGSGTVSTANLSDAGLIEAAGGTLTLTGLPTGTGALQADAGGTLQLNATGTISESILDNGTVLVVVQPFAFGSPLTLSGALGGSGQISLQGQTVAGNQVTTLDLASPDLLAVRFDGGTSDLRIEQPFAFLGTIRGFQNTSTIELVGLTADSASLSGNTLTVTNHGTQVDQLSFDTSGINYAGANFSASSPVFGDAVATITVTGAVACFAEGTRIDTAAGPIAVERLAAGDLVPVLLSGRMLRVRWVGRRAVKPRLHPRPEDVQPVCIRAHAFGPNLPDADLTLSPDHAVYVPALASRPDVPGVLVQARHLVDGRNIVTLEVAEVRYFHVELEDDAVSVHEILTAHGLPTESFLDTGNRDAFSNGGVMAAMHPDFQGERIRVVACAPLVATGAALDEVLARLASMGELREAG